MTTLYISPYRRLANLRNAMDQILEETASENVSKERELTLSVDVLADDDDFVVSAFVPGLEAENIDIEILNNTVAIRGEFSNLAGENAKFLTCELPVGRFSRMISLPVAVDSTRANATIKNGVLTLRIPKAEAHRPKSIKVNVG